MTETLAKDKRLKADAQSAIDKAVEQAMQSNHLPAVALGISQNGQDYYTQAYGQSILPNPSFKTGFDATVDTPFALGSVTKSFTALGVMLLQDQAKLSIQDELGQYIDGLHAPWASTEIYRYLSMTAGLNQAGSNTDPWNQIVENTLEEGLYKNAPAGTYYLYSNPSYMLMGQLIEAVARQRYSKFIRRSVLKPMGVREARVHTPTISPEDLATGYFYDSTTEKYQYTSPRWPRSSFSAGAMLASANGLTDYVSALQSGKLLTPSAYSQMWTPVIPTSDNIDSWGLGWKIQVDSYGNKTVAKNGGLPGYSALVTVQLMPTHVPAGQDFYGVTLATNVQNANNPSGTLPTLTKKILSIVN
jgi:CubicO group peptidase (beta-lactamase class C family)